MSLLSKVNQLFRKYRHFAVLSAAMYAFSAQADGINNFRGNWAYASRVIEFKPGEGTKYTDPKQALGPPNAVYKSDETGNPFEYSVSLGIRGSITLGFDGCIRSDGTPAPDLIIGEYSKLEPMYLEISLDGNNFQMIQEQPFSGHPTYVDLDQFGFSAFSQLKITDSGSMNSHNDYHGAEVDYVAVRGCKMVAGNTANKTYNISTNLNNIPNN